MKYFARIILLTLGLGLSAIALSFYPSHLAVAGPSVSGTVNAIQSGAWNVGINNTPNVNANISNASVPVTGTVAVSNTPNVNANITNGSLPVSGTVAVSNTPNVTVGNTSANPVVTLAADNPGLQPFQVSGSSLEFDFNPPVGKVLVMEYLMVECIFNNSPQTVPPTDIRLEAYANGAYAVYLFPAPLFGNNEFIVSQPIHIYADNTGGGTEVRVFNGGPIPAGATCGVSISGHLVAPLPLT
jgi:hypothetical protein